jgi:hypothetical protein
MMKELKVARSLSQLQAFMPLIGLASGLVCRFAVTGQKESQEAFVYAFLGAAAAGLVMAIPQVVLMEHVRGQVCRYKRQVNLGMTENGAGLVYHF